MQRSSSCKAPVHFISLYSWSKLVALSGINRGFHSRGNSRIIHRKGRANGAWPLPFHVTGSGSRITPIYWSIKPQPFFGSQASGRFPPTPSHAAIWLILFQEQLLPSTPHPAKPPQDNYGANIVHHPWGYCFSKESIQARPQTGWLHFPNKKLRHVVDQRVLLIYQLIYLKNFTTQYKLNHM